MWSIVYYEMKVRKLLSISGCRSWHGKDDYTPKTPCIPCSCSRRGSWRSRSSCCRRRSQRRIFPGSPRIFWGKHNDIPTYFSDLQCLSVCLRILSVSRITCFRVTELFSIKFTFPISVGSWYFRVSRGQWRQWWSYRAGQPGQQCWRNRRAELGGIIVPYNFPVFFSLV